MPKVKLTHEQAQEARKLYLRHVPQREIAAKFGVTRGAISELVRGKTWGWKNISRGNAKGEDNNAKLSKTQVVAICTLYRAGFRPKFIGETFGIHTNYVRHLVIGRKWAHVKPPTP